MIQRKKECDTKALRIVEFLIEGKLRKEAFLPCVSTYMNSRLTKLLKHLIISQLKHITQSYYQDIVEERALSKLCGYCLCGKKIPDMPQKQFHISSKQNKIYDITDRKVRASQHTLIVVTGSPLDCQNIHPKEGLV